MPRREQFNFRTKFLSDEAYELIESLSENRLLSVQIAAWAEEHIKKQKKGEADLCPPHPEPLNQILKGIEEIKSLLRQANPRHEKQVAEQKEEEAGPLQFLSSDRVNTLIEDDEIDYQF